MPEEVVTGVFAIIGVVIGGIIQQVVSLQSSRLNRKNDILKKKEEVKEMDEYVLSSVFPTSQIMDEAKKYM